MWCWFIKGFLRLHQAICSLFFFWPYSRLASSFSKRSRRPKTVPPIKNKLLTISATKLAEEIRNQRITSRDVIQAYVDRIKEVDPIINSVVEDRFEAALQEAGEVDRTISSKPEAEYWAKTKPLFGVPITIKESLGVQGLSQNGGRIVPQSRIATRDGDAVGRLRRAGAIIIAVTNTPEFCLFWESYNNANGITCNPYNTNYSAGGSSGGECALIAAGGSVIGLGSDIVGSGRLPALFCGTFGHKPTPRVISVDGHLPVSEDPDWSTFLVLSPLCRYAEDLPLVMSCSASPENLNPLSLYKEIDLKKIRIFYMEEHKNILNHTVSRDLKKVIRKAAQHFNNQYRVQVQQIEIEELSDTLEAASTLMLRMKAPINVLQKSEDPEDYTFFDSVKELFKRFFGLSNHTLYAILFCMVKRMADKVPKDRIEEIVRFKRSWQNKMEQMLGEDGVILMPVFPHKANRHYQMYGKLTNVNYLSIFNFLEMPSTAVPMGTVANGSRSQLPVGLQVAAWKNNDRLTFAVAKELESAFGGWVPPSQPVMSIPSNLNV